MVIAIGNPAGVSACIIPFESRNIQGDCATHGALVARHDRNSTGRVRSLDDTIVQPDGGRSGITYKITRQRYASVDVYFLIGISHY